MKILDIYILRKFIVTYLFTVAILIAVLIVIDLAEKIEDFNKPELTLWKIIFEYYLNFIPHYANMLSPLMIFISAVFVTAKMATHTEIIAMLSSGMSLRRILVPYMIGAGIIGVFVFFLINWTVPNANKVRHKFENEYVRSRFFYSKRNVHIQIKPSVFVYIERYDNLADVGYSFTIEEVSKHSNPKEGGKKRLKSKLEAPSIKWDEKKRKWKMPKYTLRTFDKDKENIIQGKEKDTLIDIHPEDFESHHMLNEQLTLDELNKHIAKLKLRGSEGVEVYMIEKYIRFSYPFATLILTILGVITASRKTRQGTGYQIAMGFVLALIYILLLFVTKGFAQNEGVPPQLTVWIPNIVFGIIALIMYFRVPK